MKKFVSKILLAVATLALLASTAFAAPPLTNWNAVFGQGNKADDWLWTASGMLFTVVPSVQSNSLYIVGSAAGSGVPRFNQTWFKSDTIASTLKYYQAVASYSLTNTGEPTTNVLCISSTNGLTPGGDIVLVRSMVNDNYQMAILSNTIAYAQVTYTALTNGYVAGDVVYLMKPVASFTPMTETFITNSVVLPFSDWMPIGVNGTPIQFHGQLGKPSLLMLTYSNAASLFSTGDYYVRPRR